MSSVESSNKEPYKVIVAGTRTFSDYELLKEVLDDVLSELELIEIVSGTAKGADKLGERYAKEHGIAVRQFKPDWDGLGKSAGFVRNKDMAVYADGVVVFWDGVSTGTKHMIDLAYKYQLEVIVIRYDKL